MVVGCPTPGQPCDPDVELPDGPVDPGDGASQAPVLLDAEAISATVLQLRFSKPIAPLNDVEPLDFRMSLTTTRTSSAYYGCSVLTTYQDLGRNSPASVSSVWNVPSDLELVRLSISQPITPAHCTTIDNAEANGNEGGLFIHYAAGDGASVQDTDGNALADIAGPWAEFNPGGYYYDAPDEFNFCYGATCTAQGLFPNMDAYLPIPCPGD